MHYRKLQLSGWLAKSLAILASWWRKYSGQPLAWLWYPAVQLASESRETAGG